MSADMNKLAGVLSAGFEPREVHQRKGSNGMMFDYIDDETVMDRLDDALGIGRHSWSFTVVTDTCVRGRCDVTWPDGSTSFYEDFGYANNQDGDALKEAVTDSIRRIGRFMGVARDLYRKHDSSNGSGRATSPSARPSAALRVVVEDDPTRDAPAPWEASTGRTDDGGTCPDHGQPWKFVEGGTSKRTGKPFDAFWSCDGKDDRGDYCKQKPPKAWAARHEQ